MGHKIEAGCGIREILRAGLIRDENILAGSGCAHFNCWDAGYSSFEIVGGTRDFNDK